MAILMLLGRWSLTPTGLAVFGLVGLLVLWQIDRAGQRAVGARAAVEKIERKDAANVSKATAAARRSVDPVAPGVLDPYTRK